MTTIPIITVGGIDGSGKSTFAAHLEATCRAHAIGVLRLAIDDFRRPVTWQQEGRDEASIYFEEYFDFAAIEACVTALRNGEPTVTRPVYDEAHDSEGGSVEVDLTGVELLLIEGVFVKRLPCADGSFHVHLATSFGVARRRIIERRSPPWRTVDEFDYRIARRYFPAQLRYLMETVPEQSAHVLIDNEDAARPRLLRARLDPLPPRIRGALAALLLHKLPELSHAS